MNQMIKLELPLPAVQYIVNALGNCPHREVHELMLEIANQANAQTSATPQVQEVEETTGLTD
jgi:hypothetical protein